MKTTITNYAHLDELVFENRNMTYGAYALRQKYDKHLYMGLLFAFGIFAFGIGVPEFFNSFGEEEKHIKTKEIGDVTLIQPPPLTEAVPPPAMILPKPPAPPSARFIPSVTDEIVPETKEIFENNDAPGLPPILSADGAGTYVYNGTVEFPDEIANTTHKKEEFYVVEQMPSFDGDIAKFMEKNLRYPEQAQRMGIQGKVYIAFVVHSDGSIQNVKLLRGIYKEMDEEALRVVNKMPKWNPGKQSGRAVAVHYTLPIVFKLGN